MQEVEDPRAIGTIALVEPFDRRTGQLQQVRIAEDEIGPAKAAEEFEESRTAESLFPRDRDRGPGEM